MTNKLLIAALSAVTGSLLTTFVNLGSVNQAESKGYWNGLRNGQAQAQVVYANFETNANNEVKLVLNRQDREKNILVRNPSPAEYGAIGEVSTGVEGMFIPIEQARGIESLALKAKFDGLVEQTIEEKAAQFQRLKAEKAAQLKALETAKVNEQVRLGDRYASLYGGEATK